MFWLPSRAEIWVLRTPQPHGRSGEPQGFIVRPGRLGYAIELYGRDTGWSAVRASVWEGVLRTFMPGG